MSVDPFYDRICLPSDYEDPGAPAGVPVDYPGTAELAIVEVCRMIQTRPEDERTAILDEVQRRTLDGYSTARSSTMTVESLYVWDLISTSLYRDIQFKLNDQSAAGQLEWEVRRADLLELLFDIDGRAPRSWKTTRTTELGLALEAVGYHGPRTQKWREALSRRLGGGRAELIAASDAIDRRRARSAEKLKAWRLRSEGLELAHISRLFEKSEWTVRSMIVEGKQLDERRRLASDPVELHPWSREHCESGLASLLAGQRPRPVTRLKATHERETSAAVVSSAQTEHARRETRDHGMGNQMIQSIGRREA